MTDRATFKYTFRPGAEEDAYHWTNPDGSKGGIVAVSANVSPGVMIFESAVVCPGACIRYGACIGHHSRINAGAFIGENTVVGPRAVVGEDTIIEMRARVGIGAHIQRGACVERGACVGNRAFIGRDAVFARGDWLFVAGPRGIQDDTVSVIWSPRNGLRWWVGRQRGITTKALFARIEDALGSGPHAEDYLHLIRMVETHPGLARAKAAHAAKEGGNG